MAARSSTDRRAVAAAERPLGWLATWASALRRPFATFACLGRDTTATAERACLWVFSAALAALALLGVVDWLLSGPPQLARLVWWAIEAPWGASGVAAAFALNALLIHSLARAMSGAGRYGRLACSLAAVQAPLVILAGLLARIPYLNLAIVPGALYALGLQAAAVKVIYRLSWRRAGAVGAIVAGMWLAIGVFAALIAARAG